MNVVIIGEEKSITNTIASLIAQVDPLINIVAVLKTINESLSFFRNNKKVIDLIFAGITLPDGVSFSIFKTVRIPTPTVFITEADRFIMGALEHNGIDYILKPITEGDIKRALKKYKKLQKYFLNYTTINKFIEYFNANKKTRLIVKFGTDNIALPISDIALFHTKNKIIYTIDKNGKKYIIDKTMNELEGALDKKIFFRVNRQYLININYIKGFSVYERVKFEVELTIPNFKDVIIISQETAPIFKTWISKA